LKLIKKKELRTNIIHQYVFPRKRESDAVISDSV